MRKTGQLLDSVARGISRHQARGIGNAQGGRRFHHLDRLDRRTPRRGWLARILRRNGVISLTRSASIELAKDKIRVNCIFPGLIATPLTYNRILGGEQAATQLFAAFQPWPRARRPEDIAVMALFLASDDLEFVSAKAMVVDSAVTSGMGARAIWREALKRRLRRSR